MTPADGRRVSDERLADMCADPTDRHGSWPGDEDALLRWAADLALDLRDARAALDAERAARRALEAAAGDSMAAEQLSESLKALRARAEHAEDRAHEADENAGELAKLREQDAAHATELADALRHAKAAMHNLSVADQADRRGADFGPHVGPAWADLNQAQIAVDRALSLTPSDALAGRDARVRAEERERFAVFVRNFYLPSDDQADIPARQCCEQAVDAFMDERGAALRGEART